jgi:peptidoglycan/LPS O-acetylase OafA/YrhL
VRTHTWSLAIEEHFYLVLPFVLMLAGRNRARPFVYVPLLAIIVAAGCLLWRLCLLFTGVPYSNNRYLFLTHLRVDSLFFGVLLAYFHHCRADLLTPVLRHRATLLVAGLLLLSPMLLLHKETCAFVPTVGLTELYLGYACILLALVHTPLGEGRIGRFLNSSVARVIAWIGYFSYSIYLWHLDLARDPTRWLAAHSLLSHAPPEIRWCAAMVLFVCLACLVGALLGTVVEVPALALRNRLFPAHADALTSTATTLAANTKDFPS